MTSVHSTETHISTLFFTEDRVFKLLRAVVTGFLDHSNSDDRLRDAKLELELNRRLAPDVYLGLADVVENDELVDRMIVMRRLPAERAMSSLIASRALSDDQIRSVAKAIAAFHAGLEPIFDPSGPGCREMHRQNWVDSFSEVEPFTGPVLDPVIQSRIEELTHHYLDGHAELFAHRVSEGYICDGHGDLLADDIFCLEDGPRILDCLAFDRRLRVGDVLSDIAFLAMDLHRLAGPTVASALMRHYRDFSAEHHPGSLAHHYVAYRAFVRCKVACLRAAQGAPEFAAVARMYHRLTLDQLERTRSRLVLIGGGPGTGKTSIAGQLGERFGWPVLSSDDVRKDLAKVERYGHDAAEPDRGLYTQNRTAITYTELIRRADVLLRNGESVVVDASWTRDEHRQWARALAGERRADLFEFECRVDTAVAKERVARRLADRWNDSDATPEIVDHLHAIHDPWMEAIALDTTRPIVETVERAVAVVTPQTLERVAVKPYRASLMQTYVAYTQLDPKKPFETVVAPGTGAKGDLGPYRDTPSRT